MTEKRYVLFNRKDTDYILDNPNTSLDFIEMLGDALSSEEIVDLLNEQEKRINRLENYIKSDFISSVCDNCKHMKAYRTSNWFCGVDEDIECLKGHEDMDIDDCIDFEIDLGRYE